MIKHVNGENPTMKRKVWGKSQYTNSVVSPFLLTISRKSIERKF